MANGKSKNKANFYVKVKARNREHAIARKSIAEEALSVMQKRGVDAVDLKEKDVVAKAEQIQKANGEGRQVGRSQIQKAVKEAIVKLKNLIPAKQDFVGDDDVLVLSSRVNQK